MFAQQGPKCLLTSACASAVLLESRLFANRMVKVHTLCLFVCVEVLRPSQPNGVMLSAVSLPNHTFTGQA